VRISDFVLCVVVCVNGGEGSVGIDDFYFLCCSVCVHVMWICVHGRGVCRWEFVILFYVL